MKLSVKRHAFVLPHDDSITVVPLTKGKFARVDTLVFDYISQHNWTAELDSRTGVYIAVRSEYPNGRKKRIAMHREIVGKAISVDHQSGDTLDNRGANIRPATVRQNSRNRKKPNNNTSGFKGVWWRTDRGYWVATLRIDRKNFYLGSSHTPEDCARMYDQAAIDYFGEFARTNFPRSDYQ